MAQQSVSAGWDRQERQQKYRQHASELSLNRSSNARKDNENFRRDEEPGRRKGYAEARHGEPQHQSMNKVFEEDLDGGHHARPRKRLSKTSRADDGLDVDAGGFHSQETRHARSMGGKLRTHSPPDARPVHHAHIPHGEVSPVRPSRFSTAPGQQQPLPGPPSPQAGGRRSSNKQFSSHDRHPLSESPSPPKRPRLQPRRSPRPIVDDRRQSRMSASKSPRQVSTGLARHPSPPSLPANKRQPSHREQHSPVSRRQRSESPRSSKHDQLVGRQASPSVREIAHIPDRSLSRSPPVAVARDQGRIASPTPPPPSRMRSSHRNQQSPVPRARRSEVSPQPNQDHVYGRQRPAVVEHEHKEQRRSLSKSPDANVDNERRAPSPVSPPPSRGKTDITRQFSPVSEPLQSLSPLSPNRGRTPPQTLRSSGEGREQQLYRSRNDSSVAQWESSSAPAREHRSPHEPPEGKVRSVTPIRRSPSPKQASQRLSPSGESRRQRHPLTPVRKYMPDGEVQPNRASPFLNGDVGQRSTTPKNRRSSPRPGRKRSPLRSGERRGRSLVEDVSRRRDRSRTPVGYRERSRSRTPLRRRSPSPVHQSRRSRSPDSRRRSSKRSPRREQSPRRVSPRRRSSPGRHRGSRRDQRASPRSRRAWSPIQNRRNGLGKPGNNLFIAGFNFITTEKDLERKFSRYGRVMDVRIVQDKRSGESRGFGFLTLERDEDADAAIRSLDQTEWNGRIVLVEKAKTPTRF